MSCDYFQADLDGFVTLSVIKAKLLDKLPAISHNTKKAPGALLLRVDTAHRGFLQLSGSAGGCSLPELAWYF